MPLFSQSPFRLWLRLLLGGLGATSFGAGVVAVFITMNGTGTGVLLAFGGVVLVLALLGDRIESLEFGGTKLKLRAAAAEKFALAEDSESRGDSSFRCLMEIRPDWALLCLGSGAHLILSELQRLPDLRRAAWAGRHINLHSAAAIGSASTG
jgi:hypothetical protein